MKTFKQIKEEIANVSAGFGVRGFGDVSGTPKVGDNPEINPHIERVLQNSEEYRNSDNLYDFDDDNWWAQSGAKGAALTGLSRDKGNKTKGAGLEFDTIKRGKFKQGIVQEELLDELSRKTLKSYIKKRKAKDEDEDEFRSWRYRSIYTPNAPKDPVDKARDRLAGTYEPKRMPYKMSEEIGGMAATAGSTAGSGYIAGLGTTPKEGGVPSNWAEPPVSKKKQGKHKILTRAKPNEVGSAMKEIPIQEEVKRGMFAGEETFIVPSHVYERAMHHKQKGKHWRTYIKDEVFHPTIREFAYKHPKKPIIFEDEKTGYMSYARYGRKRKK